MVDTIVKHYVESLVFLFVLPIAVLDRLAKVFLRIFHHLFPRKGVTSIRHVFLDKLANISLTIVTEDVCDS